MFALRVRKSVAIITMNYQTRNKSRLTRGLSFFFKQNLLFTNSITSGGCMAIGDLVQQEIEYYSNPTNEGIDWNRTARMFIIGTFMGPLHHFYYVNLDKYLPNANAKTVLKKVICDQLIASPATILVFFYGMGFLENKTFEECNQEILRKFKYVVMGDWLFWPPIQIVNFYYLPTHYRVVYINAATMVFNVFMSYMKHYDQHQ